MKNTISLLTIHSNINKILNILKTLDKNGQIWYNRYVREILKKYEENEQKVNKFNEQNKIRKTLWSVVPPCDESAAQSKLKILTNKKLGAESWEIHKIFTIYLLTLKIKYDILILENKKGCVYFEENRKWCKCFGFYSSDVDFH